MKTTVYAVKYYTLARGKDPKGEVGNLHQYDDTAYIQCGDTSEIEPLLNEHYATTPNKRGQYYYPVIKEILALKGFCIIGNHDE
jgi:hypothetical protein